MVLRVQRGDAVAEGFWLRAEKQTGGKGRLGRVWESPEGNLFCSTVVACRAADPAPSTLSFVTALAVFETIIAYIPDRGVQMKWPNDILVSGAKICGILLERSGDFIVIGIGINVKAAPKVADRKVTSLLGEGLNNDVMASDVLNSLSENLEKTLHQWRNSGLQSILTMWQERAHPVGTSLQVSVDSERKIPGQLEGLTKDGALRLRKTDGTLIEIHAGDVEIG